MTTLKHVQIILAIFCAFLIFLFTGCYRHWTDKEKKDFEIKCSQTDTLESLTFSLTGFNFNQIDSILIRQIKNSKIVDSFYVHPDKNSYDSNRSRYWASIKRKMYIKDTYQFVVSGQSPFVLSDMKMIMWAQNTMTSEGYGCVMGDYTIDSVRFEHNANPDFVNKGSD